MSSFPNKMPQHFTSEIADANAKALQHEYDGSKALGPFVAGTKGFNDYVMACRKFKWVLTKRDSLSGQVMTLAIVSPELKHSVAAGGIPVVTAGSGVYSPADKCIKLDNDTGHYQTSLDSLKQVEQAWLETKCADRVEFKERTDYKALFNKKGLF